MGCNQGANSSIQGNASLKNYWCGEMDEANGTESWTFESADLELKAFINEIIADLKDNPRKDNDIEEKICKYLGEYELLKEE